tara:strand:- start:167 stop:328 length:162 start_codon:yes stop_codon:yes gene_type:complete
MSLRVSSRASLRLRARRAVRRGVVRRAVDTDEFLRNRRMIGAYQRMIALCALA